MKRIVLFVIIALSAAALVPAQGRDRQNRHYPPGFPPPAPVTMENVTVTGNLTIVQGMIAVQSNGITYYTPGLRWYVGFIDSLKDGARVTLAGDAAGNPQDAKAKFLRVNKLTISGKEYDLAPSEGTQPFPPNSFRGRW